MVFGTAWEGRLHRKTIRAESAAIRMVLFMAFLLLWFLGGGVNTMKQGKPLDFEQKSHEGRISNFPKSFPFLNTPEYQNPA